MNSLVQVRRCDETVWTRLEARLSHLLQDQNAMTNAITNDKPSALLPDASVPTKPATHQVEPIVHSEVRASSTHKPVTAGAVEKVDLRNDDVIVEKLFTVGRTDPATYPRWLYTDNVESVQGPFEPQEMIQWCLMVRT